MIILGIDPGIERMGFAVLEVVKGKTVLRDCGCVKTSKDLTLAQRLKELAGDLEEIIKTWKPNTAAVEELFFSKNVKTAITVAHARGVILAELAKHNIPERTFNPVAIKLAICGDSKADKKQMQKMVQYELGIKLKSDDTVDAVGIALCMRSHMKRI